MIYCHYLKRYKLFYLSMHISHPSVEELQNNFKTSFIFDNNDEMDSFSRWLEHMDINYSRAKIPSINDGKIIQTSCIIINDNVLREINSNTNQPSQWFQGNKSG